MLAAVKAKPLRGRPLMWASLDGDCAWGRGGLWPGRRSSASTERRSCVRADCQPAGAALVQRRRRRSSELASTTSFRMTATIATFAGFPALRRA